ncbi:peptidase S8/S53 domain-containing protein [Mycena galopus ATCC 62051]|nr:peptidase S8/S53 domain-containing protein [Mycena galopus ATCC 62051]
MPLCHIRWIHLRLCPEVGTNFTGGGFSNYFSAPSYQTAAISGFIDNLPSDFTGTFNASGRGYPDVALQGLNFQIRVNGGVGPISGTSCSSPTFAGVIALINDRLVAAGKPVLGVAELDSVLVNRKSGRWSGYWRVRVNRKVEERSRK